MSTHCEQSCVQGFRDRYAVRSQFYLERRSVSIDKTRIGAHHISGISLFADQKVFTGPGVLRAADFLPQGTAAGIFRIDPAYTTTLNRHALCLISLQGVSLK